MKNEIVTLGKLKINLEKLSEFLVVAKKQSYAGGAKYKPLLNGSKQCTCQRGNFHFSDEYMGELQFPGHEIVRWQTKYGQPVWRMNYFGGVLPEFLGDKKIVKQAENVLRPALIQVPLEAPFRGPKDYDSKIGFYINRFEGDIKIFSGKEEIGLKKVNKKYWTDDGDTGRYPVFSLWYHGGLIVPKQDEEFYLYTPIEKLNLGTRAKNCLRSIGLLADSPIGALAQMNSGDLLIARGLGKTTLREIRGGLQNFGLDLKDYQYEH